jgi:putative ABC transport system permease protein
MRSDLRYAWRALWKSPATSLGAIFALALGLGATTTIFGLVNAVLLRPLPYPDAERLVEVWGTVQRQQVERRGTSFPDYFDWRTARSFDAMAAWNQTTFIAYGEGEAAQVIAEVVDGPYFELLGARPLLGRVFQQADHQPGAPPVVVINEALWEQRFNRRPGIVGASMQLDARVYTVVGVVPSAFRGRSDVADLWTTVSATVSPGNLQARGNRGFAPIARLAPGVSIAAAQAEMDALCAQLERTYPDTNEKRYAQVSPLDAEIFRTIRPAASLLFGVVALVLLIACANVASLLLSRGEARRREMSLRRALGAEDRQLVRLLLAESAILVVLGGTLGVLVSTWTQDALVALSPVTLPSIAAPDTDWRTVAFIALVGALTTVGVGLAPLASVRGGSLAQSLREGAVAARGAGSVSSLRLIVIAEVTLAVTLLVGAALLGRSFAALLNFDPGFDPRGVTTLRVRYPLPPAPAAPPAGTAQAAAPAPVPGVNTQQLLAALRALPGVRSASLTSSVPLVDAGAAFYAAEGMPPVDATNRPRIFVQSVSTGHFETMGIRMIAGRDFQANELVRGSPAAIVSENVVARFWPGQDPIGRRIKLGALDSPNPWLTIVGVVAEANIRGIPRNPTADPDLYLPFAETTRNFAVVMKTASGDAPVASAREALRRINPAVAVYSVRPLEELVAVQLATPRFLSWVTGAFAALALTLALIGIYGTLSYWVRRRTAEIGIRAALGAARSRVLRMVVGQALTLTGVGILFGALLAVGLARLMQSQLYGVAVIDWVSFAATAGAMMMATLLASVAPAVRALRVDPVTALRADTR